MAHSRVSSQRSIGSFVLQEHAHLSDCPIADIARLTYTSKASVTRFAKALGFEGWRDFFRAFMAEETYQASRQVVVDANYPFGADASREAIIEALGDLQAEAIADTMRLLNRGMLELAVRQLERARNIWVMGLSPNATLGELFCRKMLSVGKPAHVVEGGHYGIASSTMGPEDCVIVISYSGNNAEAEPMRHIPKLLERKAALIGITSEGENYLRKSIRCTLTISSRESLYSKISTFATEASITYLLNLLFSCYFACDYEANLGTRIDTARRLEFDRRGLLEAEDAVGSAITAYMGITEPILYGTNLPKKYPLISAMIGGACGGLYAGLTHTHRFATGSSGLPAILLYIGDDTMTYFFSIIIAILVGVAVTAVLTFVLGSIFEKDDAAAGGADAPSAQA